MRTAIVTGASSGIGEAIGRMLCGMDYEVFGIGRSFERQQMSGEGCFHPIVCDLLDTDELVKKIKEIRQRQPVSMLVNAAGVGFYGLHEEISPQKIQAMVRINLEVPMVLTQLLLRDLKQQKGYLINISSVTAQKSSPHGCVYGATKAGLSGFSESLFDEARKYGLKVINIQPDMTKTNLYRNADFAEGEEEESYLLPEEIADILRDLLGKRESVVATNITIRPQIHRIRRKNDNHSNLTAEKESI